MCYLCIIYNMNNMNNMEKEILLRHMNLYSETETLKNKKKCLLCKCNINYNGNKKQLYCYGCKGRKRK